MQVRIFCFENKFLQGFLSYFYLKKSKKIAINNLMRSDFFVFHLFKRIKNVLDNKL